MQPAQDNGRAGENEKFVAKWNEGKGVKQDENVSRPDQFSCRSLHEVTNGRRKW